MTAITNVLHQFERGVLALTRAETLRQKLLRFWFECLMDIPPAALPGALQPELQALHAHFCGPHARPLQAWREEDMQALLRQILAFYHRLSEQAFTDSQSGRS
ncbi:hypothetical protein [Cronobacter dublinensis]|uniref:hypothetical protein n=1 Tax=Cronobacter dublinensis TaxID=413497 RepID=UPI00300E2324|nr:hypothetical protein [Cronobacter dublinensis]